MCWKFAAQLEERRSARADGPLAVQSAADTRVPLPRRYHVAVSVNPSLSGVFRSTDFGGQWTSMGPSPPLSALPFIFGAIAAHPFNSNVVYLRTRAASYECQRLSDEHGARVSGGKTTNNGVSFAQRYALNTVVPARMLFEIGGAIYESYDKGDLFTNVGSAGNAVNAIAYGGRATGVANPTCSIWAPIPRSYVVRMRLIERHRILSGAFQRGCAGAGNAC